MLHFSGFSHTFLALAHSKTCFSPLSGCSLLSAHTRMSSTHVSKPSGPSKSPPMQSLPLTEALRIIRARMGCRICDQVQRLIVNSAFCCFTAALSLLTPGFVTITKTHDVHVNCNNIINWRSDIIILQGVTLSGQRVLKSPQIITNSTLPFNFSFHLIVLVSRFTALCCGSPSSLPWTLLPQQAAVFRWTALMHTTCPGDGQLVSNSPVNTNQVGRGQTRAKKRIGTGLWWLERNEC